MNPDIQNLKSGMIWKTISTALTALSGFFMSVIFVKFLGKDSYGELILVYTVVSIFVMLSNFGIDTALRRFIPLYKAKKNEKKFANFLSTAIALGVFFTTLFSIIMLFSAGFIATAVFHKPALAIYMRWGSLYLFTFSLFSNVIFSLYYGFQRWKEEFLLNGAYLFATFFAIFIILSIFNKGITEILKVNSVVCLLGIAAGLFYIARFIKPLNVRMKFGEFTSEIRETLRFSAPVLLSGLLHYSAIQLDKVILGIHRSMQELAQYYIAIAIGTGIIMFVKVSETVLTPYLAKFTGESDPVLRSKFQTLFRLFLHLPIAFSIFFYFLIDPFIRFAYGPGFGIAATALKIYLIVIILRPVMTVVGLFLQHVYGRTIEQAKIGAIYALVHVIFYLLLIPKYGYKGALATIILAYIVIWIYVFVFIKDISKLTPYRSLLYAGIGIAIVLGVNFAAGLFHVYNKLILSIMLPSIYLSFILLKGDIELKKIRDAI